jgi:hypothetical protein
METSRENLIAVEDLLIAIEICDSNELLIVHGEAIIDLAEFNLTPQEIEKFDQILKIMNIRLAESFQNQFPAASVISEIRRKSSNV